LQRLFDSHAHLDFEPLSSDLRSYLDAAREQGVCGWMVPGTTRTRWAGILALVQRYPVCHAALGLHPYFAGQHQESDLDLLSEHLLSGRARAVGECGLDATQPEKARQQSFFVAQLKLARTFDLPAIVHSRKTHSVVLSLVRKERIERAVVHAFSGSAQEMQSFVANGLMLGVGPVIVWPRATRSRVAIAQAPLSSLLLETDAPDMPLPGQARGTATPMGLRAVFSALCALRPESPEVIAEQLWRNVERFFRLKLND
jgi:TatD DNase family protein